jgi:dephospho-CoA kinase
VTRKLRLIGLTGGIGTGKSTAARMIAAAGIPIIDADELAREAVTPGTPGLRDVAALWPQAIGPDGTLDRRKLAGIVFADPAARGRLEAILHPRIAALADQHADVLAAAGHPLAFYEASLLVETGRYGDLDGLVVVDAPDGARIARVTARDGVTPAQVRARIAAQLPLADKLRVATDVLHNDGDLDHLRGQVTALLARLGA